MSVTVVIGKRQLLAGLSVIVLAALLGVALVLPAVSQGATYYTRSVSCPGVLFFPSDSTTTYGNDGALRVRTSTAGDGYFRCDPGLPNGAIVKQVQFTVSVYNLTGEVANCALTRQGLQTTTVAEIDHLASLPDPSTGNSRLSTTTISFATIDNTRWAYWLECGLNGDGYEAGIIGADVIYKINATNA
jgi:hypothetical protein